ncbi:MAG: hypothetical protein ACRCX2_22235 [Paraclostridium sp.]
MHKVVSLMDNSYSSNPTDILNVVRDDIGKEEGYKSYDTHDRNFEENPKDIRSDPNGHCDKNEGSYDYNRPVDDISNIQVFHNEDAVVDYGDYIVTEEPI